MTYLMLYLTETDGDIYIRRMTAEEMKEYTRSLHHDDFAIIEGNVIKNFDQQVDWSKLK